MARSPALYGVLGLIAFYQLMFFPAFVAAAPSVTAVMLSSTDPNDGFTIAYSSNSEPPLFPMLISITIPSTTFLASDGPSLSTCFASVPEDTLSLDSVLAVDPTDADRSLLQVTLQDASFSTGIVRCEFPSRTRVAVGEKLMNFIFRSQDGTRYETAAVNSAILALRPIGTYNAGNVDTASASVQVGKPGDPYGAYLITTIRAGVSSFVSTFYDSGGKHFTSAQIAYPDGITSDAAAAAPLFMVLTSSEYDFKWFLADAGVSVTAPTWAGTVMSLSQLDFSHAASDLNTIIIALPLKVAPSTAIQGNVYVVLHTDSDAITFLPMPLSNPEEPVERPSAGRVIYSHWSFSGSKPVAFSQAQCDKLKNPHEETPSSTASTSLATYFGVEEFIVCPSELDSTVGLYYILKVPAPVAFIVSLIESTELDSGLQTSVSEALNQITAASFGITREITIALDDEPQWKCTTSTVGTYVTCAVRGTCSAAFDSDFVCSNSDSLRLDYACADIVQPQPTPVTSSCDALKFASAPTIAFEKADNGEVCKVLYEVTTAVEVDAPDVTFTFKTWEDNVFNWADAECTGCSYDSSSKVFSVLVRRLSESGSVSVPCTAARYIDGSPDNTITVNAIVSGTPATLIPDKAAGVDFPLPELGAVQILAADADFSASFVGNAPDKLEGTLLLSAYSKGASSATPLFSGSSAAANAGGIFFKLPASWTLGTQCSVALRTSPTASVWPFSIPFEAATSITTNAAGETLVVLPTQVPGSSIYGFQLQCTATAPMTITNSNIPVGVAGVNGLFRATAATAPNFYYNRDTIFVDPYLIQTDVTYANSVTELDTDALAVKMRLNAPSTIETHVAVDAATRKISLTTRLANSDLAFEPAIRRSADALASFLLANIPGSTMGDFTYSAPLKIFEGDYKCLVSGRYSACSYPRPNCGDEFQSTPACVVGQAAAPGACTLRTKPVAEHTTSGCLPKIQKTSATYDSEASTLTMSYVLTDALQFYVKPTLDFVITQSQLAPIRWAADDLNTACESFGTCTASADGKSLTVTIAQVTANGLFTVPAPLKAFDRDAYFMTDVLYNGDSINQSKNYASLVVGPLNYVRNDGAALLMHYVAPSTPLVNTVVTVLKGDSGGVIFPDGIVVNSIYINVQGGRISSNVCTLRVRKAADPAWILGLTSQALTKVDGADTFILSTPIDLATVTELYMVCESVVDATAMIYVLIEFTAANDYKQLVYKSDVDNNVIKLANLSPSYMYFEPTMSVSGSGSPNAAAIKSALLAGVPEAELKFVPAASSASVALSLKLGSRVWASILNSEAAFISAAQLMSSADVTFTFLSGGTASAGPYGEWKCLDGGQTVDCAIKPLKCGDKFQSTPVCKADSHACAFVTEPTPLKTSEGCVPTIETALVSFNAADSEISVSYTLTDAAQFFAKPDLTFVITQSAAAPFRWTDSTALESACGAFGMCTASNDGKTLSVKLNQVSAPGSFVVPATVAVYDKAPFLKVDVLNGLTSVFADFDMPTMLSPINYFETVGADKLQHSAALADATHGSVITFIRPAAGTTVISAVPFLLKVIEVGSQGGSLFSDTCSLRARKPEDSLWPLGKESVVLPSLGPGAFSLATELDLSTISTLYIECSGVDLTTFATAATVNLLSVDDHQLLHIESTSITAAGYIMNAGDAARYIYLEPNFEPMPGHSSGDAAYLRNRVFSNTQNVDLTTLGDQETTARIMLGFSGASRAWVIPLYTRTVLTSLAAEVMTNADVDFTLLPGGVIESAMQGTWLCDNGGSRDTCAAPNNCGAFTGAVDCYVSPTDAAVNQRACAFVAAPTTPVSTGCGAWQCKDVAGAFVACDDASVCENGCLQSTPVAVDTTIPQQHLDPNFKSGRFQQFCVLGGVAKVAADFCPSSLVTLSPYAVTCNATTTCGLGCAGADGKAKSCDSDLSWGACGVSCGAGTQDRLTYCASSTLAIGSSIADSAAVHADLCIGKTPAMSMSRSCFGAGCEQYVWKCLDSAGSAVDCTDAAYKSCSALCGTGTQSRDVVCATVTGTSVTSTSAPEAMCAARAAKPATSKACSSSACLSATWKCYPAGGNPFTVSDCASDTTFKCAASGCRAAVSARRNVACYDGAARVASGKCIAESKPAATVDCSAVHDGCHVDFTGATCSVAGVGAVTGSCVTSAGDSSNVFRRGVCRDDKGVTVAGACSSADTDEMCAFPVCGASITYAWSTDSTAACVPGCKSYKPVTPLCMATTGSDAAVSVDVSFCASAPNKPLPYTTCPDTACLNAGVCTAAAVTFGATSVTGIYATCVCPVGFGGDNCEKSSDIDSVNVDSSSSTVGWAFTDGDATVSTFVSISISTAAAPPPPPPPFVAPAAGEAMHALGEGASSEQTLVAIVPSDVNYDGCTGFSSYTIDLSGYAPGSYEVSVQGVSSASGSAVFTAQPACDDGAGCQNGGTCNASTGKCDCVGDYSGERCQLPPCATLACNALTSSCDFLTETTAQCVCKTGFSGVRCETFDGTCDLDTTEGLCANGSARGVLVKEGTAACGACQCSGSWAGALCNTCTLACQNGGSLAAGSCDKCSCPAGFHGDACELRHTTLTLNFQPTAADIDTEAKLAVWIKRLELSLAALIGDSSVPVSVASTKTVTNLLTGTTYLQVKATAGSYAPASSEMFDTYAVLAAVKEAHFGGDSASAASRGVNSLPAFSTLSLARGVGFGDEHCANDEDTVCPSNSLNGASMPASPGEDAGSSSGLSRDDKIALGVCLGVGGAIILAIILFCAFRTSGSPAQATENTGVEMPPLATYDV